MKPNPIQSDCMYSSNTIRFGEMTQKNFFDTTINDSNKHKIWRELQFDSHNILTRKCYGKLHISS